MTATRTPLQLWMDRANEARLMVPTADPRIRALLIEIANSYDQLALIAVERMWADERWMKDDTGAP